LISRVERDAMRARILRGVAAAVVALAMVTPLAGSARAACVGMSCPAGVPIIDSFTVTAALWIPFDKIADPYMPDPLPYGKTDHSPLSSTDPNCEDNTNGELDNTTVESAYQGNGHTGFPEGTGKGGSYRLIVRVSFIWSGVIGNWKVLIKRAVPNVRMKTYRDKAGKIVAGPCPVTDTTTDLSSAKPIGADEFALRLAFRDEPPLYTGFPLKVDGKVSYVGFSGDAKIVLRIFSLGFPSDGVQVAGKIEMGKEHTVLTVISNDASCIPKITGIDGTLAMEAGAVDYSVPVTATAQLSKKAEPPKKYPSVLCPRKPEAGQ
jgi:hypothetical protein